MDNSPTHDTKMCKDIVDLMTSIPTFDNKAGWYEDPDDLILVTYSGVQGYWDVKMWFNSRAEQVKVHHPKFADLPVFTQKEPF